MKQLSKHADGEADPIDQVPDTVMAVPIAKARTWCWEIMRQKSKETTFT